MKNPIEQLGIYKNRLNKSEAVTDLLCCERRLRNSTHYHVGLKLRIPFRNCMGEPRAILYRSQSESSKGLKVSKNQNDFMKPSSLPKSNAIISRISALLYRTNCLIYVY